jgi:hypothetical protein
MASMMETSRPGETKDGGGMHHRIRNVALIALVALLGLSCAGRPYRPQPLDSVDFRSRALTDSEDGVRVTTAVPSPAEAEAIFGFPIYESRIQPVWLEVENAGESAIRFAPVGVDRLYFSPLEVAYKHKGPFSKEGRQEMERRFFELAMSRNIGPGETRSGFVFTHASLGTKTFNVDLFGAGTDTWSFTFFVGVPGFEPDHSDVWFEELYSADEIRDLDMDAAREALASTPCCTTDSSGKKKGSPINIAMIGDGEDVLQALIRAGWYEISVAREADVSSKLQYFYERAPDVIFRMQRGKTGDRNQLNVWLSPLRSEGLPIWMGQVSHYVGQATELGRALFDPRLDPDIDDARDYMLQIQWYSQGLQKSAWQSTGNAVPIDELRAVFSGSYFFTDGNRAVMWLSGAPHSLLDTEYVEWDPPPGE